MLSPSPELPPPPVPVLEFIARPTESAPLSVASTGSAARPLYFFAADGSPLPLLAAPGSGVTADSADRAFDFRGAIRMGRGDSSQQAGPAGRADDTGLITKAFTLTGWFRTPPGEVIRDYARLVDNHDSTTTPQSGFELWAGRMDYAEPGVPRDPGKLTLWVNDRFVTTTRPAYAGTDEWIFFAVTYDGELHRDNVRFYRATPATSAELVDQLTLDEGPVVPDVIPFTLGNRDRTGRSPGEVRDRPFRGLLANIRLYATPLSASQIETVRAADARGVQP
jgi:hypothetical protein